MIGSDNFSRVLAKRVRSDENRHSRSHSAPARSIPESPPMLKKLPLLLLLATLAPSVCLVNPPILADEPAHAPKELEGMKQLFNGTDLTGWDGDDRLWSVRDGVIHGQTTPEAKCNGNTFLIWEGEMKDFELRLSFRCSSENNSGIQYRSKHVTKNARNKWSVQGYQHEIRNSTEMPNVAGFIYGEGLGRGRICLAGEKATATGPKKRNITEKLITEEEFAKLFKVDSWNDIVIIAKGNHIQHFLNDRLILDFTDKEDLALTKGILALQLHAGVPMWAEFKNIRLKEVK